MSKFFGNWIIKNLLWAVVAVLGIALTANIVLNIITRHNQVIEVPDFYGLSVPEAQRLAEAASMRIDVIDSVYVRNMTRGAVFSQNPQTGSYVKEGRRILLTINSVNPKKVTMPELVGFSMRQAKAELGSRGLHLGKLIYVEDMATNNVLGQLYGGKEIKAGEQVESGAIIDLRVGLDPADDKTLVPDVSGMKYNRATDVILDNSLNINRLVFDETVQNHSDSLNAVVYRQTPAPSEDLVTKGITVTIYLTTDLQKLPRVEEDE